jgi:hypothetical protein
MAEKGGSVQKSHVVLRKLALNRAFREDIQAVRKRLRIPKEGYSSEKEARSARTFFNLIQGKTWEVFHLLERWHLPPVYWRAMREYLMYDRFLGYADKESLLDIEYPNEPLIGEGYEKTYQLFGQAYVKLYVLDASSKTDLFRIIRNSWPQIKKSIKAQGGNASRIRAGLNEERNRLISVLGERTRQELCQEAGLKPNEWPSYKALVIERLMREKYGYPEVTFEMVRKYLAISKKETDNRSVKRSSGRKKK